MRISKKICAIALSVLMAVSMMPFTASADTIGIAPSQSYLDYDAGNANELFESIEDADNCATITFTDNIVVTKPVVISADKNIKLNLNSFSLSGNIADADGKKLIQNSGELEFIGSNGGCIYNTNTAGQGHAACQTLTGGTTFVNSPIYFGDSDTDMTNANTTNRGCGIQNNGGTLIINDGYYTAIDADYTAGAWAYAILNCEGDTVVNNATVYGNGLHGALGCEAGTLTVNDGTFAVNGANNYYSLYVDGGVTTVNGGTFVNNGKYGVNYLGTGAETNIEGGTFTYTVPFVVKSSKGNPVVSGGTFSGDVTAYIADGATQDVNGEVAQTYVAKNGTTYYEALSTAITEAAAGDTITVLADTSINTGGGSNRFAVSKSLTIDGNNHTVTINGRGFGVGMNASSKVDVTFKNITIFNAANDGRCVDTRGNLNSLTLDNATLKSTGTAPYAQPLTIGGNQASTATVNIKDSTIQTSDDGSIYYAIITFNPVEMNIENSTIKGWACIYAKGVDGSAGSAGSVFNITDSTLVTKNKFSGETNDFAMFVSEDNNVTFNVTDSVLNVSATNNAPQAIGATNKKLTNVAVNLGDGNDVTLEGNTTFAINYCDVNVSGGYFSEVVPFENCADGYTPTTVADANGKYTVVEKPQDSINLDVENNEIDANVYANVDFYIDETAGQTIDDAVLSVEYSDPTDTDDADGIDTETTTVSGSALTALKDETTGRYVVNVPTAAAQLADDITVTLTVDGNVVNSYTTSVTDYCKALATYVDPSSAAMTEAYQNLGKTMLEYGVTAAAMFADYDGSFDYAQGEYAQDIASNVGYAGIFNATAYTSFSHVSMISYIATKVPALRIYFSPTYVDEYTAAMIGTAKVNGVDVPFEKQNIGGQDYVCLDITSINPEELDDIQTIVADDCIIEISALKYADCAMATSNTANQNFGRAIYQYNAAASATF